jgi:hypothetical protein
MRRQARFQRLEIKIAVQIGEDRALRLQPFDPGQRLADAEMAGMRTVAQRIDDPQIEAFERLDALCGQINEVARIGDAAEAISERGNIAVVLQERQNRDRTALPFDRQRLARFDAVFGSDRRIIAARRRYETVAEAHEQHAPGRLVDVNVEPTLPLHIQSAQIVDAVGMIGMLVRVEHAVEPVDFGVEELLAQVGRGVDQNRCSPARAHPFDQERAAPSPVFRIAWIAGAPAKRRARHPSGRSASENSKSQSHLGGEFPIFGSAFALSPCGRGRRGLNEVKSKPGEGYYRRPLLYPSPALASLGHPLPQGERVN